MSTSPRTLTCIRIFVDEDSNTGIFSVSTNVGDYRVSINKGGKVVISLGSSPTLVWETTRASLGGTRFDLQDLALLAVINVEGGQLVSRGQRTDIRPFPENN